VKRKESSGKTEEAKDDKRGSDTKAESNRQLERPWDGTRRIGQEMIDLGIEERSK
jgi:hypothetical protein